jgi:hypothetical protein
MRLGAERRLSGENLLWSLGSMRARARKQSASGGLRLSEQAQNRELEVCGSLAISRARVAV